MGDSTQIVILCGGENRRWNGHRNYRRKHFLEIDGEALLSRTLRMVAEHSATLNNRVNVVVNREDEALYAPYRPVGVSAFTIDSPGEHQPKPTSSLHLGPCGTRPAAP